MFFYTQIQVCDDNTDDGVTTQSGGTLQTHPQKKGTNYTIRVFLDNTVREYPTKWIVSSYDNNIILVTLNVMLTFFSFDLVTVIVSL